MSKTKNPNIETPEQFQKRIDKELEFNLSYCMGKMRNEKERLQMVQGVREYANLLDDVQELDHYVRLNYWQATYAVFNYLRQSDALGRQSEGFSKHVKKIINESSRHAYVYAER